MIFRFQTLLDYHHRLVEDRQIELAETQRQLLLEQAQLALMQANRARYGDQLQRMLDGVLHIDEIEHQYRYLTALDDQLTTQRMVIVVAEEAVESARARLEEALKKRKRLEKLKEYDQQSFELTMRQREANQLDDINIARYNRSDR